MNEPVVDALAKALFQFAAMWPFIGALMALMLADIVMGTVAAFGMKKLNSTASFQGICKKTITLILVGVCEVVGRLAHMPLAEMAAGGYCMTELLSIAEKAAMCGVKFPSYITEVLEKVRPGRVPESASTTSSRGGA